MADLLVLLQTGLGSQLFRLQSSFCIQACCLLLTASLSFLDLQPAVITTKASSFKRITDPTWRVLSQRPLVRVLCKQARSCWSLCWWLPFEILAGFRHSYGIH